VGAPTDAWFDESGQVHGSLGTTANLHDCRSEYGREMYDSFMESDKEALALVIEFIQGNNPDITLRQAEAMAKSDTYRSVAVFLQAPIKPGTV